MPRKRTKRTVVPSSTAPSTSLEVEDSADLEVERRVSAIRAIRDVEIEHILTELRLLRSCLKDEQLDAVALKFVSGMLPDAAARQEDEELFDVNLGGKDDRRGRDESENRILASMRFRHSLAAVPSLCGHKLQSGAGKAGVSGYENLQMSEFVLDEQMETQMLGLPEYFQTPGFASQRLSIGMTPKTLRLPKPGEMLLSVHGSPLGVYKEENMESINETDEG